MNICTGGILSNNIDVIETVPYPLYLTGCVCVWCSLVFLFVLYVYSVDGVDTNKDVPQIDESMPLEELKTNSCIWKK